MCYREYIALATAFHMSKLITAPSENSGIPQALDEALRLEFSSRYMLLEGIGKCPIPLFVINQEHVITQWNEALEKLTGLSEAQMLGTRDHWKAFYPFNRPTVADLTVDDVLEENIDLLYKGKYRRSPMLEGGYELSDFFPTMGKDGRWLYFMAAPLRDPSGNIVGAIETLQDVTDRAQAEARLQENQSFLKQVVDGSSVPTFVIDREHRITHWNRACEVVTGIAASSLIGTRGQWRPFYETERPVMADLILSNALAKDVDQFYGGKFRASSLVEGAFEAEDFFPHLGEGGKWLFFTAAPLRDAAGNYIGAIETLQDITAQKVAESALRSSEEKFRVQSITDALTGLYNARHFYTQLGIEIKRAMRYERPLSLLLLDLDDFKKLNDTHGHLEGDRALALAADIIRHSFRDLDSAYRYGGEEFTVLLPETATSVAVMLAERLRANFAQSPLTTSTGEEIRLSASIGISEYLPGEADKEFLRRADECVYEAKRRGKNCVVSMLAP